jgi:hypothetical protein
MTEFKPPNRPPTNEDLWTLIKHRLQFVSDDDMDEVIAQIAEHWASRIDVPSGEFRIMLYELAVQARIELLTARRH